MFSAGMPGTLAAGIESAAANLAAKLVSALIADREGFSRVSRGSGEARRRGPEPASKAAWYETSAAPASAASPEPAAAPAEESSDAPRAVAPRAAAPPVAAQAPEPPSEAPADEAPPRPSARGSRLTASQAASELVP